MQEVCLKPCNLHKPGKCHKIRSYTITCLYLILQKLWNCEKKYFKSDNVGNKRHVSTNKPDYTVIHQVRKSKLLKKQPVSYNST